MHFFKIRISQRDGVATVWDGCYGTRSLLKNIRVRGRIIFLFFPARRVGALKIWQTNSAILKVPDAAWNSY
jgi:hypothetical protein